MSENAAPFSTSINSSLARSSITLCLYLSLLHACPFCRNFHHDIVIAIGDHSRAVTQSTSGRIGKETGTLSQVLRALSANRASLAHSRSATRPLIFCAHVGTRRDTSSAVARRSERRRAARLLPPPTTNNHHHHHHHRRRRRLRHYWDVETPSGWESMPPGRGARRRRNDPSNGTIREPCRGCNSHSGEIESSAKIEESERKKKEKARGDKNKR